MEGPCRDLGSRNGSRSLIVRHIVHLKTFNVRGQRTVESQVMHLPATSSSESGARRGCFCGLFDREPLASSVASSSVESRNGSLPSLLSDLLLPPKKDGNGWLIERE